MRRYKLLAWTQRPRARVQPCIRIDLIIALSWQIASTPCARAFSPVHTRSLLLAAISSGAALKNPTTLDTQTLTGPPHLPNMRFLCKVPAPRASVSTIGKNEENPAARQPARASSHKIPAPRRARAPRFLFAAAVMVLLLLFFFFSSLPATFYVAGGALCGPGRARRAGDDYTCLFNTKGSKTNTVIRRQPRAL